MKKLGIEEVGYSLSAKRMRNTQQYLSIGRGKLGHLSETEKSNTRRSVKRFYLAYECS